jgi:hypothetical protein
VLIVTGELKTLLVWLATVSARERGRQRGTRAERDRESSVYGGKAVAALICFAATDTPEQEGYRFCIGVDPLTT